MTSTDTSEKGLESLIVAAPVSYTHLDVYKRQVKERGTQAIRVDVLAAEHGLNERQAEAMRHVLSQGAITIGTMAGLFPLSLIHI